MSMSDINFSPNAVEKTPSVKDLIFQWVIKNGKRIVIFTQAIVLLVFLSRFKFDTDVRNITQEVEKNQAIVESLADVEAKYVENQAKLGLLRPIIESQIDWKERLDNFTKKIPNDMVLGSASFTANSIKVSATTETPQSFQLFLSLLIQDPSVKGIILESSKYDRSTNEYYFVMSVEI